MERPCSELYSNIQTQVEQIVDEENIFDKCFRIDVCNAFAEMAQDQLDKCDALQQIEEMVTESNDLRVYLSQNFERLTRYLNRNQDDEAGLADLIIGLKLYTLSFKLQSMEKYTQNLDN